MRNLLDAALSYAGMGLRVFPVVPRGKTPATARGHNDATTDEAVIRSWWAGQPDANIGVVAGNGLAVLDVDPGAGGLDSLRGLYEAHGKIETLSVRTGSGGLHLYLRDDPENPLPQSAGRVAPGLDIRAGGKGYVVGVGSVHPSGGVYSVASRNPVAPVPEWLREAAAAGRRAVTEEAGATTPVGAGARNDVLASLAGSLRRQGLSPTAIEAALQEVNGERCQPPLPPEEVRVIAASVGRYRPGGDSALTREDATEEFEATPGAEPPRAQPSLGVQFSDEWMVDQVQEEYQELVRYVPPNKRWFTWEGHVWRHDEQLRHEEIVRDLLRRQASRLLYQARAAAGDGEGKAARAAARRFQSATGISAVVRLLQARVAARPTAFDQDPMALNTPKGVVDLGTGEVSPAEPGGMHSRAAGVGPAPGEAPLWTRFLRDLTGGDEELTRYIQKVAGYALTGDVAEKTLWFIWGSDSDTGKSTFIRVLSRILGDYTDAVDVSAFISSGRDDTNNHALARLAGARLVTATEPAAGRAWDEKRIKAITGGDEVQARFLYGQFFTYQPQFKIMIVGNHEPEIRTVDDAMLRRLHIVPFNRKVPREDQIENLSEKLVDREGPQILQWMVEGCLAWAREGMDPPAVVLKKTQEYEEQEDTMHLWVEECCDLGPQKEESRRALYGSWVQWCKDRGEDPGTAKTFKRRVDARHDLELEETQVGARRLRGYRGLQLSTDDLEDLCS